MLILAFTLIGSFANDSIKELPKHNECNKVFQLNDVEATQRSGCCSWHSGVCGCSNGRAQCCDGTLSPSCTCKEAAPLPETIQNKG